MTEGEASAGAAPESRDIPAGPPEPAEATVPAEEAGPQAEPEVETPAPAEALAPDPEPAPDVEPASAEAVPARPLIRARRRRDPLASALIGILTLLLGFAFAVQIRSADTPQVLAGAREEDLVRILDELNAREDRLRGQIAEQRTALDQLTNSDSQSATALDEARRRAEAIGILNGTVRARGPGLRMVIGDPDGVVRVEDMLDAID